MAVGLWGGVLLATFDLRIALAITGALLIVLFTSHRWRIHICLILVGAALIVIREGGERGAEFDTEIEFAAIARSDSDRLPERVFGDYKRERLCSLRVESRSLNGRARELPLRVITDRCDIFFGERIAGRGRLRPTDEKRVAALLIADEIDSRASPALWRILSEVRLRFRDHFKGRGDAHALVPGMVIGDESLQGDEFQATMRLAGLSHLTAVSGANFSIVATMVLWLVSLRVNSMRVRLTATALVLLIFTLLVRPSPSVLRAAVMALVVLIAQMRGDRRSGLLALSGAVAVILLIDPYQGLDPGFALSVLATAGIISLSPRISAFLSTRWHLPQLLAELIAIPASATIFCTPIIVAISGKIALASLPLNIAVAPLVPLITISGFSSLLLTPLPLLPQAIGDFAALLAAPLVYLSQGAFHMPIFEITSGVLGALISLTAMAALWALVRLRARILLILLLMISASLFLFRSEGDWQLYQCDVGQGDALLVRTSDRSAILVDTGPDPELIDRCLRQAGIKEISLLVITHGHADHFAGTVGVLRGRSIDSWWISNVGASDPQMLELQERIGTSPTLVSEGMRFDLNGVGIEVLSPDLRGFPSINDSSLVLRVTKDDAQILITGDIEIPAQDRLAARYDLSTIDIYKVTHHGSRFRSADLDAELAPSLALISVGSDNPFGHPAAETLERLAPALIHRTDLQGAARVSWWPLRIH